MPVERWGGNDASLSRQAGAVTIGAGISFISTVTRRLCSAIGSDDEPIAMRASISIPAGSAASTT
jgi:hypothetical protein